jgi:hypothetical protein
MTARRVLYSADKVHALFGQMRAELHEMAARHRAEVESLRRELDGIRALHDELRSVSLARSKAEIELGELRRLRDIGRARAAARDPAMPLN